MPKICFQCQSANDDAAMVCSVCGKAFDAPAAYAPPQPQQPYAQQLYAPVPQTPAAPPKKKPKVALWVIIGIVVVVGIALALVIPRFVGQSLSSIANANYYEIDGESIPSMKAVGGSGKLTSFTTGTRNGGKYNTYTYSLDSGQGPEVYTYLSHLVKSEDFAWISDVDSFEVASQSGVQCARESRDDGYVLVVEASWDSKGYVITLSKVKGTLTVDDKPGTGPVTDPRDDDKDDLEDFAGDDPPFIKMLKSGMYFFERRVVNLESGEEYDAFDALLGERYCVGMTTDLGNGKMVTIRFIYDAEDRRAFYINDTEKQYMELPYDAENMSIPDFSNIKVVGTGTDTIKGETLKFIDYGDGEYVNRYYIKNGDVYAIQQIGLDGSVVNVIHIITKVMPNPPSEYFTFPSDYTNIG